MFKTSRGLHFIECNPKSPGVLPRPAWSGSATSSCVSSPGACLLKTLVTLTVPCALRKPPPQGFPTSFCLFVCFSYSEPFSQTATSLVKHFLMLHKFLLHRHSSCKAWPLVLYIRRPSACFTPFLCLSLCSSTHLFSIHPK